MLQQTEQRVDLAFCAGGLDGQRLRIHVHHAHAEQTHDLQHVGTVGLVGGHLDEHQLALHGGFRIEVHDLQHMQQLVELFDDLLKRHFLHVGRDGDAGNVRTFGGETDSELMLNARRANRPAIRASTPGRFSTSTDSV